MDAKSILWLYRRPVAHRTQNIGMFYYLIQFLNICGIISNSFIIAFTSSWSKTQFGDDIKQRLIFAAVFEVIALKDLFFLSFKIFYTL